MGYGTDVKFYVNANLCPAFKNLAYNCRLLKKKGQILDTWSNHGKVVVKLHGNTIKNLIHEMDLFNLFPNFNSFTFNTDFYKSLLVDTRNEDDYDEVFGWKET